MIVISKWAIAEPRTNPWLRAVTLLWLYIKKPFLLPRVRKHVLESVRGVPLLVWPDVLNPLVFRSGKYFAEIIARLPHGEGHALDVGTGSGICAIFAARQGYRVIAVDINPEAVRCAKINCLLNAVDSQVDVRQGDLFDPVRGHRFDLIMFNPPFFRGEPKSLFDMSWRSPDIMERFAANLADVLTDQGQALILLSTDGDCGLLVAALQANGFSLTVAGQRNFGNEIMTIYAARPAAATRGPA